MNNLAINSESLGCFGNIVFYFFGIVFLAIVGFSIHFLTPIAEKAVQENFCKSGTIDNERTGRRRTTICIDKKTGRKTDVSLTQVFGCCPTALIFVVGLIFMMVLRWILPDKKTPDDNSGRNYGNSRR